MKVALHAAAPCAIPVKEQMIEWWGPVVYEYYAGTEGNGMTAITAAEWLAAQRLGRARDRRRDSHLRRAGEPVPPLTEGTVYFAGGRQFEYHNAPQKTLRRAQPLRLEHARRRRLRRRSTATCS